MYYATPLTSLSGFALVISQVPGATLIEGSPTYDGPIIPGITGKLGNAAITTNNPLGVSYTATLPDSPTTGVRGFVKATTNSNGTGVAIQVSLSGFPDASLGPFLYHIHDQPVPADGNCTATLGHLDPFIRGEIPPCDPTQPETCQVGDLSGKHGNITVSVFNAAYIDLYVSTEFGFGSFLGNRSINIHTSNTTRLTCANFVLSSGSPSNTTNSTVSPTSPTPAVFTGAGITTFVSMGAIAAGLIALFL
ncbi:hypothetical protein N7G274_003609 [Stereocaulon virgatum]|uniref:Superoxide dismutase copper/zinc binding domain-containing protein n=1 Tax=Stereocaulon virgatum TaxID=373712 RepID=A0ABR4AC01_9LECA